MIANDVVRPGIVQCVCSDSGLHLTPPKPVEKCQHSVSFNGSHRFLWLRSKNVESDFGAMLFTDLNDGGCLLADDLPEPEPLTRNISPRKNAPQ